MAGLRQVDKSSRDVLVPYYDEQASRHDGSNCFVAGGNLAAGSRAWQAQRLQSRAANKPNHDDPKRYIPERALDKCLLG